MTVNNHWFLHVDLDAFFASVEQLDHPEYRGKPVIVGGKPEDKRSVVSTASYEARKFGVHSAMPTYQAYKLCPQGIFVYGRMERYSELSYKIMNIFRDFSPDVDQMSIDEAFIDITGTENLFGPPEETAFEIKKRVKEYTGLTVSVGLATNKYLAKIASAMSKPDGFYFVKPGTELDFMMNLPLEKVWGVGKKTLETIRNSGIKTTREIYEKPIDVLQFLYGNNMGNFLYNVVRGNDIVDFGRKPKTQSISTETTFVEDITDIYTVETKLLELCHYLIFRILKKQSYSRTAMVKIRYGDFTTVSIQRTVDYNILTLDTLFNLVKELFNEKYDKKSGIRLIGVGLENLQKNPHPEQLYLFEENKEKNQNVEKAILNLEQKHPEIKVQKARLLFNNLKKTTRILILAICLSLLPKFNYAQTNTTESKGAAALDPDTISTPKDDAIPEEEKESDSILSWSIPLKSLDYELTGYWSGEFVQTTNLSFGNKTPFGISFGTPIFKQEVDFSALINITNNWYFNLEFADQFAKNTYSLGYKNSEATIDSFLLSNRNITFPEYSSTLTGYSLTGGDNQAPGASLHLQDQLLNRWSADFMLRYDITTLKDATFYGKNVITDYNISLSDYLYGKVFVIPDADFLMNIKDIYVENSKGTFKDEDGFCYKKVSEADYLIISSKRLLIISGNEETYKKNGKIPKVLITFNDELSVDSFLTKIGSYSDSESFLGQIQEYFNSGNTLEIKLSQYTPKLSTKINNEKSLIIQQSQGFSPFLFCGLYDCGIIQTGETSVVSSYSETISQEYYAQITDDFMNFSQENFFYENHLYTEAGKYEQKDNSFENPAQRYPFADKYPLTYLSSTSSSELNIRLRNYSPVTALDIGKKVSGGSVRVYINGILDSGAIYENTSGFVTTSRPVSDNDKIYITWNEETDNMENGSLSAAAGYKYNFTDNLSGDISLSANLPLWTYSKTNYENTQPYGFAAVTGGINFENDNWKVQDGLSIAFVNNNLTGNYLAYNQTNSKSQTYYLSYSNGYETHAKPFIDDETTLLEENNGTEKNYTGVGDSHITGYKIPLSWDFSSINSEQKKWASVDVKLNSGYLLSSSSSLEIALFPEILSDNMDIYLQLGIKAEKDFSGENTSFIPTWKISDSTAEGIINPLNQNLHGWQIIKIQLTEEDRSKLLNKYDLRLIAVSKNNSIDDKGLIYIGPYEPCISGAIVKANEDLLITSKIVLINESPSSKDFFKNDNLGTEINWINTNPSLTDNNLLITTSNYFEECNFSTYKTINLDFFIEYSDERSAISTSNQGLTLTLEGESEVLASYDTALQLNVYDDVITNILATEGKWHTVSINLHKKTVSIDDTLLSSTDFDLSINNLIKPSKFTFGLNTGNNSKVYDKGVLKVGNIYFKDSESNLSIKNNISANYEIDELFIFKNISLDLNSTQATSLSFTNNYNNSLNITASENSSFSVSNIKFGTAFGVTSSFGDSNKQITAQGTHSIETISPFFDIISFSDVFYFNNSQKELQKNNKFKLDFSTLKVPLSLELKGSATTNRTYISQKAACNINSTFDIHDFKFALNLEADLNQKINKTETDLFNDCSNYFVNYGQTTAFIFSEGNEKAYQRKEDISSKFSISIPYFSLNPSLSYILNGAYKCSTAKSFTDKSTFQFSVPFVVNKNSFAINFIKSGGGISENTQTNYYSDIGNIFQAQGKRLWFYTSIPFVDLFSTSLSKAVCSSDFLNSSYSTKYEFSWKRSLSNSSLDFYLPVSSSLSISRDITSTDVVSDIYQVKLTVGNSFINMLGKNGKLHWFNWFTQDEYTAFLTGIIKIPANNISETTLQCSWYGSLLMYIDSNNSLRTGADFTISTNTDWKIRTTGIWNHNGKDSIILRIPEFFFNKTDFKDTAITRKETLNISFSQTSGIHSETFEFNHNCDLKLKKNYNLNAGIGANLVFTENAATTLALELSLGGKIQF